MKILINALIIDILKPLNIPVVLQKYSGTDQTYITFHEYLETGQAFEDDSEALTGHYIQVDIWSTQDYTAITQSAKDFFEAAGFKRLDEADLYEPDTGLYHKGMRLFYLEAKEVD